MPAHYPTENELVATLRRSQLPTVIVEGKEDERIYRWVEARIGTRNANVLPVGGRDMLLAVYKRRNEYAHLPVAFVADRDMWLFSGIPTHYHGIIWTQGYSIENDLYAGADLENQLESDEAREHQQVLASLIKWFSFEVEEHLAGREAQVNKHCNEIVPIGVTEMDLEFRTQRGFRPPGNELYHRIRDGYKLQLRGKSLFQILLRFLNAPGRGTRYNTSTLHEIAFKQTNPHELMNRLINLIERTIMKHTPPK